MFFGSSVTNEPIVSYKVQINITEPEKNEKLQSAFTHLSIILLMLGNSTRRTVYYMRSAKLKVNLDLMKKTNYQLYNSRCRG
jgi:hypothetical protein